MRFFIVLSFVLFLCAPNMALAAPYCVNIQGMPSECYYDDANLCRERASEVSGLCKINPGEIELPSGYGNYCLVASGGIISCIYQDFDSCERVAINNNGICTFSTLDGSTPQAFESDVDSIY